jgi:hypothetical protein
VCTTSRNYLAVTRRTLYYKVLLVVSAPRLKKLGANNTCRRRMLYNFWMCLVSLLSAVRF